MLRRSGALLKGLGGGHRELQLTLAQLAAAKDTLRAASKAQQEAFEDVNKWAQAQDNRALQDTLGHMSDLMTIWATTQLAMASAFKELRQELGMVLEGEKNVDKAKHQLQQMESKEATVRKEVKRRSSSSVTSPSSSASLLSEVEKATSEARIELGLVKDEQEAVKMLRVKNGLIKVTQGLQEASEKGKILVEAARTVVEAIPTVTDATKSIQDVRYTSAPITLQAVMRAKERLESWTPRKKKTMHSASSSSLVTPSGAYPDHPPPYAEAQPPVNPFYASGK